LKIAGNHKSLLLSSMLTAHDEIVKELTVENHKRDNKRRNYSGCYQHRILLLDMKRDASTNARWQLEQRDDLALFF